MMSDFRILDMANSHVGKVRSENEDSHSSVPQQGVWLVADGMGGHFNGRFASQTIADAVSAGHYPDDLDQACHALAKAIHDANAAIYQRSVELGKQMGSTAVALVLRGGDFVVLWAGDSRAYVYRARQLIQLTRDHTQVEMMLERGLLTPQQAADHPMKHVLGRAVGVQETLELDAVRDAVMAGDVFLLCSDGLHGVLGDDEIAAMLGEYGANAGARMIEACLERGAPDNVTITLVAANEPTLLHIHGAQA